MNEVGESDIKLDCSLAYNLVCYDPFVFSSISHALFLFREITHFKKSKKNNQKFTVKMSSNNKNCLKFILYCIIITK